jgi:HPt (histidine-containing phosphotransfer) domain-containing protein
LESFIDKGELKEAFDVAHALKGVLSNLSLTPLYEIISELTEQLRISDSKDLSELLKRMWEIKKKFDELI